MLISLLLLLGGFILLLAGAEVLVRGACSLAIKIGISPIVVGLTIVAFGTSAPELAVSLKSTSSNLSALALGNVVGSNIANIGLVLGITALINPIKIERDLVKREIPMVIVSSVILWILLYDGELALWDGIILSAGLIAFLVYNYFEEDDEEAELLQVPGAVSDTDTANIFILIAYIVIGLALLIFGSDVFVDNAIDIARSMGVSEAIIGLTLIAVGTSIPELATCIVAARRNQPDIAMGNVVGSNMFNILGILGLTAIFGTVSAAQFSQIDFVVMLAFSLVLLPMARSELTLSRLEGLLLLSGYFGYMVYLVLMH